MPHYGRTLDDLLKEVQSLFEQQSDTESLLSLSKQLQIEFKQHLALSSQCMLPSFNYTLPTGKEQGTYLASEVGGSNLRIALVELNGRDHEDDPMRVIRNMCFPIDDSIRRLQDYAFFDWMAQKIRAMVASESERPYITEEPEPLRMGVAWSFPIGQTSISSGNVLGMGKGFFCSDVAKGHDLGEIIHQACQRGGVNVRLEAIVNDSSSALLARAWLDPATRLACILGTGMNAAIHLPIASLHPSKFSSRLSPQEAGLTHVLTNTELSMYGKNTFPSTRWDELLNSKHIMPDYQPFEYLVAGRYMGEIVRLIMVEATKASGLFDGLLPPSLETPYVLDTRTLAQIEIDTSVNLQKTRNLLNKQYQSLRAYSYYDASFIRQVVRSVTRRSVAYFTTGIHALSSLLQDMEDQAGLRDNLDHITLACDGSVINKYPGYMERAQQTLDKMITSEKDRRNRVIFERTQESAVLGAGVAAAMAVHSPTPSGN